MATFSLKVEIAPQDLKELVEQGFNFCLARDIEYGQTVQPGNIVFSGFPANQLAQNLVLQWEDNFQVLGVTEFHNPVIRAVTKPEEIQEGQQATIDENGNIQVIGTPQPSQPFRVVNDWQQTSFIGVSARGGTSGTYNLFFFSPPISIHMMAASFLPLPKYSIFWDRKLVTGTTFDTTETPPFSFQFTSNNEITVRYVDGKWSIVNQLGDSPAGCYTI